MTRTPGSAKGVRHAGETAAERPLDPVRDRAYDEAVTMTAWERFLTGENAPGRLPVRRMIERSWARSVASGVDAHGGGTPLTAADDQLDQLRDQNHELLAAAGQTFKRAARLLEEASAMIVLTDRDGVILKIHGDNRTIDAGQKINLEPGGNWNEGVVGTNGIGTALSTGEPVFVHAAEHFCEGVKAWTCAGAPIRDPLDHSIIGLIDISGPIEIFRRHNVALAVVAAEQIEFALGEHTRAERLRLLEACLATIPSGSDTDGVVVLDRIGRIIHLNDKSLLLRAKTADGPELRIGSQLVDLAAGGSDQDIVDRLPEKLRPSWLKPIMDGGDMSGAILIYANSGRRLETRAPPPLRVILPDQPRTPDILGDSEALQIAISNAKRIARGRASVLVEGETGVGKELFAQLIHTAGSADGKEPFIAFNCGAVSKDLLGAELFGHVAGAFTGAAREGRAGRFELANGGTLCLDEIGEMPFELQSYLLRVLEEGAVYRLGDGRPRPVDVRLVALTNRNLKDEVAAGRFRQDLYFRISAATINIPPLRERASDIGLLIDYFNRMFAARYGGEPLRIDPDAWSALREHDWPGNVRELRNVIESLTLMSTHRDVTPADLPGDLRRLTPNGDDVVAEPVSIVGGTSLEDTERQAIEQAIEAGGGNLSVVAKKLEISRSTLYRKMKQYALRR